MLINSKSRETPNGIPLLMTKFFLSCDTPAQRSKSVSGPLTASQKAKNCQSERHLLTVRTAKNCKYRARLPPFSHKNSAPKCAIS